MIDLKCSECGWEKSYGLIIYAYSIQNCIKCGSLMIEKDSSNLYSRSHIREELKQRGFLIKKKGVDIC